MLVVGEVSMSGRKLFGLSVTCPLEHDGEQTLIEKVWQPPSGHSSTHLFDLYSVMHLQWGIIYFLLGASFLVTNLLSIVFEIIENTPLVINFFRRSDYDDYNGDTIVNIIGDHIAVVTGWLIARFSPWRWLSYIYLTACEALNYIYGGDSIINMLTTITKRNILPIFWREGKGGGV
jgi:hypothetical protein